MLRKNIFPFHQISRTFINAFLNKAMRLVDVFFIYKEKKIKKIFQCFLY